jgi:hypothetical protein
MTSVTDLLYFLASEVGMIYSIVLLFVGFVFGIFVWRWYEGAGKDAKSLSKGIEDLEGELDRVVTIVSELWERATPPIKRQQDLRVKSYRGPERSRLKTAYRKTLGKLRRPAKGPVQISPPKNMEGRIEDFTARLKSQADKISLATSFIPSSSKSLPRRSETAADWELHDKLAHKGEDASYLDRLGSNYDNWQDEIPKEDSVQHEILDRSKISTSTPEASRNLPVGGAGDIVQLYNSALSDNLARERFREQHQPIRIGTVNAVERRQNPTIPIRPQFRETTDGDFFAFLSSGENNYLVMPRLGLTISDVTYNAGALGEMFGNPSYDSTRSYSRYQVRKAAIFRRDGDRWELQSPGQLDLGPGD